jgi:hypothetical protein
MNLDKAVAVAGALLKAEVTGEVTIANYGEENGVVSRGS